MCQAFGYRYILACKMPEKRLGLPKEAQIYGVMQKYLKGPDQTEVAPIFLKIMTIDNEYYYARGLRFNNYKAAITGIFRKQAFSLTKFARRLELKLAFQQDTRRRG